MGKKERKGITHCEHNLYVGTKISLNAEASEGNTYTPGTGCCSN